MKKAQITATKLPFALLIFSLVVVVFFTVPYIQDVNNRGNVSSFWSSYEYSPTDTTLSNYNAEKNVSNIAVQVECDILGNSNNLTDCPDAKAKDDGTFINLMVNGGYGAIVTLFNSVGIVGIIWTNAAEILNIPPIIATIIKSIVILFALISLIYLIFNRSESA